MSTGAKKRDWIAKTVVTVVLLSVVFAGFRIFWPQNFYFVITNEFKLPRNTFTEQIDKLDQIYAKGSIKIPRGQIEIHVPSQNVAGTEVNFRSLKLDFSSPTTLHYDISFILELLDEQPDTDKLAATAVIDRFQFDLTTPMEIKYGDMPVVSVARLQVDEVGADGESAEAGHGASDSTPDLGVEVEAQVLLGYAFLQAMLDVPFETSSPLLADINAGNAKVVDLPKVSVDALKLRLGEGFQVGYHESSLLLESGSEIELVNVRIDPEGDTKASGKLQIDLSLGGESKVKAQSVTLSNMSGIDLIYSGEFKVFNDRIVISDGESVDSSLIVESCRVTAELGPSTVKSKVSPLRVALDEHSATCLLKGTEVIHFAPGDSNQVKVSLGLQNCSIKSEYVSATLEEVAISDAAFGYEVRNGKSLATLELPSVTPIRLSKIDFSKSDVDFALAGEAELQLPAGDLLRSRNLKLDMQDFCAAIDSLTVSLPSKGLVRAEGVGFEMPQTSGTIFLADKRGFDGSAALKSVVSKASFFDKGSGKPTATLKNVTCDLRLVGADGQVNVAGSLSGGEGDVDGFKIKSGDVSVALGGLSFGEDTIEYSRIVLRVSEGFLNRLIATQVKSLNQEKVKRDGSLRYEVEVSRAKAKVSPRNGDRFSFSGSARVRGKYETKTLPRVRMERKTKKVTVRIAGKKIGSKTISWDEPRTYMDWMRVASATANGTIKGNASVSFNSNVKLSDLEGKLRVRISKIEADVRNFPGGVETVLNNYWKDIANLDKTHKFKPFKSFSGKNLKLLSSVTVKELAFENEPGVMVLVMSGSSPR
ncbi:hypothetical protein KOR34_04780 [Posidoniimonas corsicana]|uniref:Uncharacterized protein n=1 Tax=Posidoniimonas corsicana TaxID=1938618 RepID=A0A5C5VD73_9BACT|nr:DUF945 domain-containing protein [Posidoniimonas corsicana]TWT35585.1 hypothetical protein KOR34_04780 [Posidoniimonas corsicana]